MPRQESISLIHLVRFQGNVRQDVSYARKRRSLIKTQSPTEIAVSLIFLKTLKVTSQHPWGGTK
jgi:hypothetical protein